MFKLKMVGVLILFYFVELESFLVDVNSGCPGFAGFDVVLLGVIAMRFALSVDGQRDC
jgi:hypothetical protein